MKYLLQRFGEKLKEWFGSEKSEKKPTDYIKANRNGKLYVDDIEGYLEAGNCFEKMENMSKCLKQNNEQ